MRRIGLRSGVRGFAARQRSAGRTVGLGFTSGEPWLPQPPSWAELSVTAQREDAASVRSLYRRAIAERPSGEFAWRESPAGTLVFERGSVVCLVNSDAERLPLPGGELILSSSACEGSLRRDTAAWVRT